MKLSKKNLKNNKKLRANILKQILISQKEIDGGKIIKGDLRNIIKNS